MDAERAIEILEMMKPFSPGATRENRERDKALWQLMQSSCMSTTNKSILIRLM